MDIDAAAAEELARRTILQTEVESAGRRSQLAALGQLALVFGGDHIELPVPAPGHLHLTERPGEYAQIHAGLAATVAEVQQAVAAIEAKASSLGYRPEQQIGKITPVPGGYVARYPNNDIYVVPGQRAYEVRGDIRAKYLVLNGPAGPLGMPQSDENPTGYRGGAYNHFVGGSIYWAPHTGPFAVRGRVRDRWAAMGWERSSLGYPVRDQHRMAGSAIEWCVFENGAIAADATTALPVPAVLQTPAELNNVDPKPASLTYAEIASIVERYVRRQFHESPHNVGLHPGVQTIPVTGWEYDFWVAKPRSLGFVLRGFHDNGLAPDTHFKIHLSLRFHLAWPNGLYAEPTSKSLVAELTYLRVVADGGLPSGEVISGVTSAIHDAFFGGDAAHPELPLGAIFLAVVPTGANPATGSIDILDVIVTAPGELQLLVSPLAPPGSLPGIQWAAARQNIAQAQLDSMKGL
ncbi:hypothetical protein F4553_005251 [Allocatelliglobosispora scoriae]|uniref:Uncharacterized protein n=1 Tax=Allocatelliglobosispora scoriae TaxID=643052 RepID=A0A841BYJ6_9ACTN|nr:hypothetical protein [Allocatelliglobosispora scoriae]MBB5871872.1 hypothetical protein [Allocatelliglobosispora scoriae]